MSKCGGKIGIKLELQTAKREQGQNKGSFQSQEKRKRMYSPYTLTRTKGCTSAKSEYRRKAWNARNKKKVRTENNLS